MTTPKKPAKPRAKKCAHKYLSAQNDPREGQFLIINCRDCDATGYVPVNVQWTNVPTRSKKR